MKKVYIIFFCLFILLIQPLSAQRANFTPAQQADFLINCLANLPPMHYSMASDDKNNLLFVSGNNIYLLYTRREMGGIVVTAGNVQSFTDFRTSNDEYSFGGIQLVNMFGVPKLTVEEGWTTKTWYFDSFYLQHSFGVHDVEFDNQGRIIKGKYTILMIAQLY
jgi:hypothetical protein